MAKKDNENNFFNIFNVDISLDETNSVSETDNVQENFHSIFQTIENDEKEISEENIGAQTTMFDDESLFSSANEDASALLNDAESVSVDDNTDSDTSAGLVKKTDSEEEAKLVSLLETNPLDDQCSPHQLDFFDSDDSAPDIFQNIISYKELKKMSAPENFETPYLYAGKHSERIRYRLHLPSENNPKANRTKKNMFSWILTILSAIIIAVILRSFVFVIATVDGPSMNPTLEHNEKLFVTKYSYKISDIKRGDIVICRYGTEAYPLIYVKRVIGLGGEMISIVNGEVIVNGQVIEENYILDAPLLDMEPVYVPEGYVFVMGDNRNNSADSRKPIIGPLKKELIIGKVRFRVMPLNKFGALEG